MKEGTHKNYLKQQVKNLSWGEVVLGSMSMMFVPLTTGSEAGAWLMADGSGGREPSLMMTLHDG